MDPRSCRERLSRVIIDETAGLVELATLLEKEHGLLESGDVGLLETAIAARQDTVSRIMRADEERQALCREVDMPSDAGGLEQLMKWCDPEGLLERSWSDCKTAALRCRTLNDRNGTLVNAQLSSVRARLGTLLQGGRQSVTYGRDGAYGMGSTGRVVTTEA